MPVVLRDVNDLNERLHIQFALLKLACDNYDQDIEIAGFNIATSIRVFLHDTRNSTSALTHISRKNIRFLDTCLPNTEITRKFTGLIYGYFEGVHDGQGGMAKFRPLFTRKHSPMIQNWIDFESWWNAVVFQNPDGSVLTRRSLVLTAVNMEGGAHIDNEFDEIYDTFRHHYSSGQILRGTITGAVRSFDNVPVLPAIRQIGYELIESFKHAGLFLG